VCLKSTLILIEIHVFFCVKASFIKEKMYFCCSAVEQINPHSHVSKAHRKYFFYQATPQKSNEKVFINDAFMNFLLNPVKACSVVYEEKSV
jgi:hypothetical protein